MGMAHVCLSEQHDHEVEARERGTLVAHVMTAETDLGLSVWCAEVSSFHVLKH